ncbi:MAG: YjzC family protein [Nannocystis sp.]|nr:YjzC family protein [Nannocystis sp.]
MQVGERFKTGQTSPGTGSFVFDGYLETTNWRPAPTTEERVIPLSRGETFPPIRSQSAAAWWKCQRVG